VIEEFKEIYREEFILIDTYIMWFNKVIEVIRFPESTQCANKGETILPIRRHTKSKNRLRTGLPYHNENFAKPETKPAKLMPENIDGSGVDFSSFTQTSGEYEEHHKYIQKLHDRWMSNILQTSTAGL
jgi:hypothetical protein